VIYINNININVVKMVYNEYKKQNENSRIPEDEHIA
jgi:hypothetical protein